MKSLLFSSVYLFFIFFTLPASVVWAGYQNVWSDSSGNNYYSEPSSSSSSSASSSSSSYTNVSSGPSQAQLRDQRLAVDAQDAALDAGDNAYDAYERGDYAAAIEYYEEALEYAPDDPDLEHNLDRARVALRESKAARQLKSVKTHSKTASMLRGGASSMEARKGFDTAGDPAGTLKIPPARAKSQSAGDPKVPFTKRTVAIAKMELKREIIKLKVKKLKAQRKKLDPVKDAVRIVEIKQEETDQENQIHYLNFSINEELQKAPEKKSKSEKSAETKKGK